MCNPPLLDERTGRRASSLSEAASLFADLVARRDAHDLLRPQPARRRADLPVRAQAAGGRPPTHADRDHPLPRRLHAAAAARDRAPPRERRAARRRHHQRARAGHRHRPPRRGDVGHVPRHGREPAPAVGPRGPHASAAASRCTSRATTRSTSSSAAIPRSSSSGPSRRRSSTTPPRDLHAPPAAPPPTRRRSSRPTRETLGAGVRRRTPTGWSPPGELRERDGRYQPREPDFPAGAACRCAPPRRTASRSSRPRRGEMIGFVEAERAFSTVHPGAVYLHLGEPYEVEELDIDAPPRARAPRRGRLLHAAQDRDRDLHRGDARGARRARRRAALRDRVGDAGGRRLPAQAPGRPRGDRPPDARPARAELRHAGALVRAPGGTRRRAAAARRCSARCTRPSTRRSPCCR